MEFCFRYSEMKGHVAGAKDSPVNRSLTMMIYKSFKIGTMFLMEGVICIKCFWSHGKILFLAEIIASQRSALMCNCIAPAIFNRVI